MMDMWRPQKRVTDTQGTPVWERLNGKHYLELNSLVKRFFAIVLDGKGDASEVDSLRSRIREIHVKRLSE